MSSVLVRAAEFGWGPELLDLATRPEVPLHMLVEVLQAIDPATLEPISRVDYLRAWDRVEHRAAAGKSCAVTVIADSYEQEGKPATDARFEVGAALRLSPVTASDRTRVALALRDEFPRTGALLEAGDISYLHAANLVRGTEDLPTATAAKVEDAVLARLPHLTPAEARRAVADAVVRVDPQAAAERAAERRKHRRLDRVPDRDGQSGIFVPMDVAAAGDAWAHATSLGRKLRALRKAAGLCDEGLDAARADVAVDLLRGLDPLSEFRDGPGAGDAADPGADAAPRGRVGRCSCGGTQTAAVVIDLPTLLGLADNPGSVLGYGAIPAELAREMAADRDFVRWLVAPDTGELLDVSPDTHRPGDRLQRFIRARDQRCGFPGCNQPALRCQLDHVRRFGKGGGKTIRVNLGPLCQQHHNAKTHGGWTLVYDPTTRTKTWTSPLGTTYVKTDAPRRT